MNINIESQEDNELEFEIEGEDHGFSNLLVATLREMEGVKIAQYDIEHPELNEPNFYIETEDEDPIEMVEEAAEEIKNQFNELKESL